MTSWICTIYSLKCCHHPLSFSLFSYIFISLSCYLPISLSLYLYISISSISLSLSLYLSRSLYFSISLSHFLSFYLSIFLILSSYLYLGDPDPSPNDPDRRPGEQLGGVAEGGGGRDHAEYAPRLALPHPGELSPAAHRAHERVPSSEGKSCQLQTKEYVLFYGIILEIQLISFRIFLDIFLSTPDYM